jgi:thymidylate synthase (FAD)
MFYGTAKIIAVTRPEGELSDLSLAEFLAYVARVSNPQNQHNHLTAVKLLRYLATHSHWSPFEMVNIVVEMETTRDIARQVLRHRSFSFQEFSQRYANPVESLGFVNRELRLQDHSNRQNSLHTDDQDLHDAWEAKLEVLQNEAIRTYNWAIQNGVAKEVARSVLPEGLIMSKMYVNGTLRSWIHYCSVRMHESTQLEHRELAESVWNLIVDKVPPIKQIHMGE